MIICQTIITQKISLGKSVISEKKEFCYVYCIVRSIYRVRYDRAVYVFVARRVFVCLYVSYL